MAVPDPVESEITRTAQATLDAAITSVNNVLLGMRLSRAIDRELKGTDLRGRIEESNLDLLRAAVVFGGAGADATLKALIKTALHSLLNTDDAVQRKFTKFVESALVGAGGHTTSLLAECLSQPLGPYSKLVERYIQYLTGGSLQSATEVDNVCGALGISDTDLRKRTREGGTLDKMFKARNQMIHELDIDDSRRKRTRKVTEIESWCKEVLSVSQEIVNSVARKESVGPSKWR